MTLEEAVEWCAKNRAMVRFEKTEDQGSLVIVNLPWQAHSVARPTLLEAVQNHVGDTTANIRKT